MLKTEIRIEQGDLTTFAVDAIVNAANNSLVLGGGLAGAIRTKGGPSIQDECDRHGPVEIGQAAITGAGDLRAKHVIHQASMELGGRTTAKSLRDSTRAVLQLAEIAQVQTLAMPATGTGIAGFDVCECAEIMVGEVVRHVTEVTSLTEVYFVLFDAETKQVFQDVLAVILEGKPKLVHSTALTDANDKEIVLQDYVAETVVGVQIGTAGHKLWVCIDGVAVLRVKAPQIELDDMHALDCTTKVREHLETLCRDVLAAATRLDAGGGDAAFSRGRAVGLQEALNVLEPSDLDVPSMPENAGENDEKIISDA